MSADRLLPKAQPSSLRAPITKKILLSRWSAQAEPDTYPAVSQTAPIPWPTCNSVPWLPHFSAHPPDGAGTGLHRRWRRRAHGPTCTSWGFRTSDCHCLASSIILPDDATIESLGSYPGEGCYSFLRAAKRARRCPARARIGRSPRTVARLVGRRRSVGGATPARFPSLHIRVRVRSSRVNGLAGGFWRCLMNGSVRRVRLRMGLHNRSRWALRCDVRPAWPLSATIDEGKEGHRQSGRQERSGRQRHARSRSS